MRIGGMVKVFAHSSSARKVLFQTDDLRAEIDKHRPFPAELAALWQERLRIDWTYNSNALEGNTLTYGETAFFLREGLTSEGKPLKDYIEAKNHAEAIDYLAEVVRSRRRLTEGFIKELHALLLRDISSTIAKGADGKLIRKPLAAGRYKTRPNHVLTLSGSIHKYTDPLKVLDEMEALLAWLPESRKSHPLERATIFHYRFVAIHPFDDGNGRMARLLMNLILMRAGYPPAVIRNARRREYLAALERADDTGHIDKLLMLIGEELVRTQKTMLAVLMGRATPPAGGEALNRDQRREKILRILETESLSISQLADRLPFIKRPTLKHDLQQLVKTKKIKRHGRGKAVIYSMGTS